MPNFPVCVKTPKGIEEVERRSHGLPLKARQVLIMVDGRRDLAALEAIFPPAMVVPALAELLAGGFIRELAPSAPPATSASSLQPLKAAFSSALYDVFGPDADNFTGPVDKAKVLSELSLLAAKYEEVVARMGGRKKAEVFGARLRQAGIDFVSVLAAGPGSKMPPPTPAASGASRAMELRPLKESITRTLFEYLGPDADAFTGKVDAATSVADLDQLARKYAEVVAGMSGKKKAGAFLAQLWQAGFNVSSSPPPRPPDMSSALPVSEVAGMASPPSVEPPKSDGERLDMARQFMLNTATSFSGVAGSSLSVQINQARDLKQLRALYYDWREALQMSVVGRQRLDDLERRLAALLS